LIEQLPLLETMSSKEYYPIRALLGEGSGRQSPGFKIIMKIITPVWEDFKKYYLHDRGLTIEKIYDAAYHHSEEYLILTSALFSKDERAYTKNTRS